MGINTKAERKFNHNMHIYQSRSSRNKNNNQIINVALDTNTVFNLFKVHIGKADNAWTNKYVDNLKILLSENRKNPDGTFYSNKNKRRFVYWILPTVQDELNQFKSKELHDFINRKMCKIDVRAEYELKFNTKVASLANEYATENLIKEEGLEMPSNDAYIMAESAIFNLPLISNDKHIVGDVHSKYYRQNKEMLKKINKFVIGETKNQAEPMTVAQFLHNDKHERSYEFVNSQYLDENLQFMLEEKLECPQTSFEKSLVY